VSRILKLKLKQEAGGVSSKRQKQASISKLEEYRRGAVGVQKSTRSQPMKIYM
jgi:hypothetical protein